MPILHITRHGETEWNLEQRTQGWGDSPLTAKGRQNACELGARLRQIEMSHQYVSPSGRAIETLELIGLDGSVPVTVDERLREIHMGAWEGQTVSEIRASYPVSHTAFWETPHEYIPETGESFEEVRQRIISFLERLSVHDADENILIVTHGIFLKVLLTHLQQKPVASLWDPPFIHGTSLTIVEYDETETVIRLAADMSHVKTM
ncbi:histidine phosphatase family protein [uncultured Exiguobacterium sp.]|uniref:histidine phosphatase family protein n=1 Tax=uncultured Exiguobacterium sp. TaxID=202669 RepID=UPI0025D65C27|nr:histidine phosphatase family protein [uncultured Exiguobacterium sp.]